MARNVRLGISDGNVVEVTKGLKEGESVLEFVPGDDSGPRRGEGEFVEGFAE